MIKLIFFTMIVHTTVYASTSSIAKQLEAPTICDKLIIKDSKRYKIVSVPPAFKNPGITDVLLYDEEIKATRTIGVIALKGENVYGCSIFTLRPESNGQEYKDWELEYEKIGGSKSDLPELPIIDLINLNLDQIPEGFKEGGELYYYTSVIPDNNYASHKISLKLSLIPHCDTESKKLRYSNRDDKATERLKSLYEGWNKLARESFQKIVEYALDSCDPERKIPKSLPETQLLLEQELAEELPFSGTLNDSSDSSR